MTKSRILILYLINVANNLANNPSFSLVRLHAFFLYIYIFFFDGIKKEKDKNIMK